MRLGCTVQGVTITQDRDATQWAEYYADLTAAYQDALAQQQPAVAEATITLILEGIEPLVRRAIAEAMGGRFDEDLAHDCWLAAVEVVLDHAARYAPGPDGPNFSTWVLTKNGPLRNAVRRVLDEQLTGAGFSKAELALLRVAGAIRADFASVYGRDPSFEELQPLVAGASDAWARNLVAETKPHLGEWEFEAAVLHKLTKSGSAGALRNLKELLRVESIREAHPDTIDGGWDVVDEVLGGGAAVTTPTAAGQVDALAGLATASLSAAESAVLMDRVEDPAASLAETGRRHGLSAHAVKSVLAKSANTVIAPHAQFAFLHGVEDMAPDSDIRVGGSMPRPAADPMGEPHAQMAFLSGLEAQFDWGGSGVGAVELEERPLGARLALAAALVDVA